MARLFAPRLDWPRYGRGISRMSPTCFHDNYRSNTNGVPIPSTPFQMLSAFETARRESARKSFPLSPTAHSIRLIAEIQRVAQNVPSGDEFTPIAERICYQHLNGF